MFLDIAFSDVVSMRLRMPDLVRARDAIIGLDVGSFEISCVGLYATGQQVWDPQFAPRYCA